MTIPIPKPLPECQTPPPPPKGEQKTHPQQGRAARQLPTKTQRPQRPPPPLPRPAPLPPPSLPKGCRCSPSPLLPLSRPITLPPHPPSPWWCTAMCTAPQKNTNRQGTPSPCAAQLPTQPTCRARTCSPQNLKPYPSTTHQLYVILSLVMHRTCLVLSGRATAPPGY